MSGKNSYGDLGGMMNLGDLADIFETAGVGQAVFSNLDCSEIKIYAQQRDSTELETEEQTLPDLAKDIAAQGVIQPIVVCENDNGPELYRLVCGERRLRAAQLAGLATIPSMVYGKLTLEQIDRIQYAENTQRLNLSLLNEARVLQKDFKELGSIKAVADKRNKNSSWISKRLSLLELPDQTKRLLVENVTADIEVINTVKQIEKIDPAAAAATVQELKENVGKKGVTARDTAKQAKEKVKPSKPKAEPKAELDSSAEITAPTSMLEDLTDLDEPTPNHDHERGGNSSQEQALPAVDALATAYSLISESGADPQMVLSKMQVEERDSCAAWLTEFYEAGIDAQDVASAVMRGFRNGQFATNGHGAFALAAFLYGLDSGEKFSMLNILGSVKQ